MCQLCFVMSTILFKDCLLLLSGSLLCVWFKWLSFDVLYKLSNAIISIYMIFTVFMGLPTIGSFPSFFAIFTCQNFMGAAIPVIRSSNDITVLNKINIFIFFACQ